MVATTRRMARAGAAGRNNNTDNITKSPNSNVNGKPREPKILRSTHKKTISKKVVGKAKLKVLITPKKKADKGKTSLEMLIAPKKKVDKGKAKAMNAPKKADDKNKGSVRAKVTALNEARPLVPPTVASHKAAGVHGNQHQIAHKPPTADAFAGASNARKTRNTRSAAAERTKQLQKEYLLSATLKPPQAGPSYANGGSTCVISSLKIEKPSEQANRSNLSCIKAATKELEHDTATRLESSLDIGEVFTKRPDLKKTKPKIESTDAQPGRYIVTGLRQCHMRTTTSKAPETDAINNANISDERKQTDKTVPAPDLTSSVASPATPPTTPTPTCPKPKKSWAARAVADEDVTNPGEIREIHRQLFTDEDTDRSSDVPDINFINALAPLDLRTTKALVLIDSVEDKLEPVADHNQPFYVDGPFAEFNESDQFGGRNTNQAIQNQLVEDDIIEIRVVPQPQVLGHSSETEQRKISQDKLHQLGRRQMFNGPAQPAQSSGFKLHQLGRQQMFNGPAQPAQSSGFKLHQLGRRQMFNGPAQPAQSSGFKQHQLGRQQMFNGPAQPAQSSGLSLYSPQPQPPQIFPGKLYHHRFVTFFECPKCCRQFTDMLETQIHFAMCQK